jgi:hypothetical protein
MANKTEYYGSRRTAARYCGLAQGNNIVVGSTPTVCRMSYYEFGAYLVFFSAVGLAIALIFTDSQEDD